jgi:hypothetical protein
MASGIQLGLFPDDHYTERVYKSSSVVAESRPGIAWMARQAGLSRDRALLLAQRIPRAWLVRVAEGSERESQRYVGSIVQAIRAFKSGGADGLEQCIQVLEQVLDKK